MKPYLILVTFIFFGCKKQDTIPPVIELVSPAPGQVFAGGETVHVNATITDETGIHMVHAMALDEATDGHLMHMEEHFDGKRYELRQSFMVLKGRTYFIEIEATDHDDNITKKQVEVSAN